MYKKILGGLALALGAITLSHAALPDISLSFVQPTGTVSTTDPIEVWVHVSSDRAIGTHVGPTFGLDAEDVPLTTKEYNWDTHQWDKETPFASYTGVSISTGYSCGPCDAFGYEFISSGWDDPQGFPSIVGDTLRVGDYRVGTFVPTGAVVPGTYLFPLHVEFQINVTGLSASGQYLGANLLGTPGAAYQACSWGASDSCGFTRTVVAASVPEASTMLCSLLGMAMIAGVARRRRRTR